MRFFQENHISVLARVISTVAYFVNKDNNEIEDSQRITIMAEDNKINLKES
jgi:hypothetical protein